MALSNHALTLVLIAFRRNTGKEKLKQLLNKILRTPTPRGWAFIIMVIMGAIMLTQNWLTGFIFLGMAMIIFWT